ncbi:MAG: hypothetical protein ACXWUG_13140 [Polyangiales bacterium]
MSKNGSFLAWLGTGLLVATAPFVARAQLDEAGVLPDPFDTGTSSISNDTGTGPVVIDSGFDADAAEAAIPGPTLPNGDAVPLPDLAADTGKGCTCTSIATAAGSMVAPVPLLLIAAWYLRRRARK